MKMLARLPFEFRFAALCVAFIGTIPALMLAIAPIINNFVMMGL